MKTKFIGIKIYYNFLLIFVNVYVDKCDKISCSDTSSLHKSNDSLPAVPLKTLHKAKKQIQAIMSKKNLYYFQIVFFFHQEQV